MISKVTIYGERCSGTNYLEKLIRTNFNVEITWQYGWKHFFGFNDLTNTDDVLFICIVRNPYDWFNSLYTYRHHLPLEFENIDIFLNNEVCSTDNGIEILTDHNLYTNCRYKNLFELRHVKLQFLINDMPNLVTNYILIKYENLINDFEQTMHKIANNGQLEIKSDISFPINYYKCAFTDEIFNPNNKKHFISNDQIKSKINVEMENKLNYII